jgi:histidinol phosphatase-like enzyme (inositol monophosphatase family)
MGEEFGSRDLEAEFVWVLDPIDGTAPFVAGIPVFGTLIAVARCGRPWIGVIDHPASNDRWVGVSRASARLNGKPVRTRPCPELAPALMTNSNPDFFQPAERAAFDALRRKVRYTQYGGSCYAYGVLASGRTDLAVDGGLDPVDIFAPAAVIEGAGGVMTDWSGAGITLGWKGLVLAAGDPGLHAQALSALSGAA